MKRIVIRRTVTLTDSIPFDKTFYPDCDTPEEAVTYELEQELGEKLALFSSQLDSTPEEQVDFSEVVTIENQPE